MGPLRKISQTRNAVEIFDLEIFEASLSLSRLRNRSAGFGRIIREFGGSRALLNHDGDVSRILRFGILRFPFPPGILCIAKSRNVAPSRVSCLRILARRFFKNNTLHDALSEASRKEGTCSLIDETHCATRMFVCLCDTFGQ